jgi:hypothetical protein
MIDIARLLGTDIDLRFVIQSVIDSKKGSTMSKPYQHLREGVIGAIDDGRDAYEITPLVMEAFFASKARGARLLSLRQHRQYRLADLLNMSHVSSIGRVAHQPTSFDNVAIGIGRLRQPHHMRQLSYAESRRARQCTILLRI